MQDSKRGHCRMISRLKGFSLHAVSRLRVCFLSFFFVTATLANPVGGEVQAGGAVISSPSANTVQINQTTDKAIIDWRSFNIDAHENTQFNQPSSCSITLNRIDPSQGASSILGRLSANGQIWLLNPAGVLFGAGARVDASGLLVTTGGISNSDFMTGHYHFIQSPDWHGAVINNGNITIADNGLVALVAPGVENNGVITANMGAVVLAAGNSCTLDFYGDHLIAFDAGSKITQTAVDIDGKPLKNAVSNNGQIIANGGKVLLTAQATESVINNAINMAGYVEATTAQEKNGEVVLAGGDEGIVQVSGEINASGKQAGQHGGTVKILGEKVGLVDNAHIDVSGDAGGGEVLIGGNLHGAGPEQNAKYAYVGKNAVIDANALTVGNAGKVIVWSDDATRFFGSVNARGGILGGDGGFVETSGHNYLDIGNAQVNTFASAGNMGTWLLDPANVTIQSNGGADSNESYNSGNGFYSPTSGSATSIVDSTSLANKLANTSITITTTNTGSSGGSIGNITVASPITWAGFGNLTLNAANDITINTNGASQMINSTGGASLTLTAGDALFINGNISVGSLTINGGLAAAAPINIGANITGPAVVFTKPVTLTGTTSIDALGYQAITFNSTVNGAFGLTLAGQNTLGAVGNTTPLASLTTSSNSATTLGGNVTTTGAQNYADAITLSADTILTSQSNGAINFTSPGGGIAGGNHALTFSTGGSKSVNGAMTGLTSLSISAGTGMTFNAAANGVTTTGAQTYNDAITLTANTTTFTSSGSGDIAFNSTIAGGAKNLTVNTSGATTFGGSVGGGAALSSIVTDAGGSTAINNSGVLSGGLITINDPLTLGVNTTLTVGGGSAATFGSTVNGAYALSIAGSATFGGAVGNLTPLTSVSTTGGSALILTGNVTTTGLQSYGQSSTTIAADTILSSTGGGLIRFLANGGALDGAHSLRLSTTGAKTINTAVGGGTPLTSFTIDAGAGTTFGSSASTFKTTGSQSFGDAITLGATTTTFNTTTSGNIVFGSSLSGSGKYIVVTPTSGSITLTGNISTGGGDMTFNGPVLLAGNASLSSGGGFITFNNTINDTSVGAHTLSLDSSYNALTVGGGGAVGGITGLGGLSLTSTNNVTVSNNVTATNITLNAGVQNILSAGKFLLTPINGTGVITFNSASAPSLGAGSQIGGTSSGAGRDANVIFTTSAAGTTIDVGGSGTGSLVLSAATLDKVFSNNVRIGDATAGTGTGALKVAGGWTPAANFASAGTLTLAADGTITQTAGAITLGATTDLLGRATGSITLNNANLFRSKVAGISTTGAVAYTNTSGNTMTVDSVADDLGTVNGISGATGVTLIAPGTADIILNKDVVTPTNGVVTLTAGRDIKLNAGNINATSVSTASMVLAAGGQIAEVGAGTITSGAGNRLSTNAVTGITLNNTNSFGRFNATNTGIGVISLVDNTPTLTISSTIVQSGTGAITVNNTGAITLTSNITANANNLSLIATQGINQTGGSTITQTAGATSASFTAGAGVLSLTTATNDFVGAVALSNTGANAVSITDTNALNFGTVNIGQNFAITAGGTISQTGGAFTVPGTTTITATAAATDVQLDTQANNLTGAVSFGGTVANIRDVGLRNTNASAALPTNLASTSLRNLSIIFDNAGVALPALTLAATGTLSLGSASVNMGGDITQTGALVVPGVTTIYAGAHAITLTNAANDFTGAVALNNSGANNISVTDANAIVLGTSSVGTGTFTINATGANTITQTGAITQAASAGAASFTTGAGVITLGSTNNFTGAVSLTNGTGANNITLVNGVPLTLGTISLDSGTLSITGTGGISQTGGSSIVQGSGTSNVSLTAGAGAITLTNSTNNFRGAVALSNSGNNNIAITDLNAIRLNTSSIGTGTLTVVAGAAGTSGLIGQSGPITQAANAGAASFSTVGNAITLTDAGNSFTGAVSLSTTGAFAIQLTNGGALTLGTVSMDPTAGVATTLGITAGGSITQTGAITEKGGVATFTVTAANSDILLHTQANTFNSKPVFTVSGAGTIRDLGYRNIASTANTNFPTLPSGLRNLTLQFDADAMTLPVVTLTGNLTAIANGTITQSGAISGGASGLLTAKTLNNSGSAITLNNASNNFVSANLQARNLADTANAAGAITYQDINGLDINAINTASTIALTAGGAITQSGNTLVGAIKGTTLTVKTLNTSGAAITLNNPFNDVTTIDLRARNAGDTANAAGALTYQDATGIDIANLSTTSNITLTAGGAISDSGVITAGTSLATTSVGGTILDFAGHSIPGFQATNTGSGNIQLENNVASAFTVGIISQAGGGNIIINNNNASNLSMVAGITTDGGNFSARTTNGSITFSNALNTTSAGNISLTAGNSTITGTAASSITTNTLTAKTLRDSGGSINLANATANYSAITIDLQARNAANTAYAGALNVTYAQTNGFDVLGAGSTGAVTLTSGGAITQNNALSVVTGSTLIAKTLNNSGAAITLNNAANDFTTIDLRARNAADSANVAGDITYRDATGVDIAALNTLGNAVLTTSGAITQSGVLTINGVNKSATFAAGSGNDITLGSANNFTSVGITSGNNVSVNNSGALILNASTVGGTLGVTTSGAITQSGILNVTGATTLAAGAGNNITLNSFNNIFSSVGITNGNNVLLNNVGALALNASTISGTLGVTTSGAITQNGILTITGATTLAVGSGNNITLGLSNDFSSIGITTGNNVSITDANALALNASTISGTLGMTTSGAITQNGILSVGGAATLAAGAGNNITLATAGNDFNSVGITTGNNVSLVDTNALILNASTVSGTLGVTAGSHITQSGVLTVTGTPTFAVSSAGSDILLAGAANSFTVTPVITNNGNVRDLGIRNILGSAVVPTLPTGLRNLTLNFDNAAMALSGTTLTGTLSATAGGAITQNGILTVPGTSSFSAGANAITLGQNNALTGAVALSNAGAFDVSLTNNIATLLATSSVGRNFSLTSNGAITQNGILTVPGTSSFSAGANAITLGQNNALTGAVTLSNSGAFDVSLTNNIATLLATSSVGRNFSLTSNGAITQNGILTVPGTSSFSAGANAITLGQNNALTGAVTFSNTGAFDVNLTNNIATLLATSSVGRNFSLTSNGAITQNGILTVPGTSSFSAGANAITLGQNNALTGAVTLSNSGAFDVSLTNNIATLLATSSVGRNFSLTSNGAITQTGVLNVAGGAATFSAGSGNNITLGSSNNFSSIGITTGNNVSVTNAGALALNASTISGTLDVTTGGAITQNGILNVTGATTLAAGSGNNITLGLSNDFSSIGITSGNNVSITDANAIALNASTISGTLGVTTGGVITQNGILNVTGATTLAAGSGNNITLNNSGNDFSTIGITSGNNVTLRDTNALTLGASTVSGNFGITTNGAAVFNGTSTVGGTLDVNTTNNGAINQTAGTVSVTGITTLIAGISNDITFNNSNNFSSIGITSGNNVSVKNAGALALNASTVSGTLDVMTGGSITQNGALNVVGATTLTASGPTSDITLNTGTNDFSSIGIAAGRNVNITDANTIALSASTISGTLGVNTSGTITQNGILNVTGAAILAAGSGNNITLGLSNDFSSIGITTGNNVNLTNAGALALNASTISGTLGITTGGAITQNGILNVTGATTLAAGSGNNITLGSSNSFSSIGITTGNNVSLTNAGALLLNASTVSGTLGVTTGGNITQAGALNVTGATTLTANGTTSDITLNTGTNDFSSIGIAAGRNVSITDANAIALNASTITGTLGVNTSGAITQNGTLNVTGATTLAAGSGNNITLGSSNNFSSIGITTGNNVSIANAGALALNASTINGTLGVTTGGAITQNGILNVTGATTLAAGSGNNITLGSSNNFSSIGITTGNNVSVTNVGALALNASTISGTLGVTTGGAITQNGILTVAGASNFSAGANAITLGQNNALTGAVTLSNSGAFDVSLTNNIATLLATSSIGRNFSLTSNGAITQNGILTVPGTSSFSAGANAITLGQNNALTGAVTLSNSGAFDVSLTNNIATLLATSSVGRNFSLISNGAITQTGILNVAGGAATFAAGSGNNITLGSSNNFSSIGITTGNNVSVTNAGALALNASTISGTLDVTTGGAITQNGILNVTGATTLAAGGGNNITLNNSGNDFSTIGITSGNNVTLRDTNALTLGASTVSGNFGITTNGAAIFNGTSTVGGTLDVDTTNNGAINQTAGTLSVTGITTLVAGSGNDITFNNSNNFSSIGITSGNNASVKNAGALALNASTVSGTFDVMAGGSITQNGALNVTGVTTLTASGPTSDITLNAGTNDFSSIGIAAGRNVSITDANAIALNASTISGTLGINTSGAITQNGIVNVTGATTLAAGSGNNITLGSSNNFSSIGITSGNNVAITNAGALALNASTISGTLGVTTGGAITQNGILSVTGATTLAAGSGNNITLGLLNSFSSIGITSGNNVNLTNAGALALNASTISGALGVNISGAITQNGILNVTGATTLAAGSGNNITLGLANNFSSIGIATGNNVSITDANAIALNASTISGTLGVNTGGAITQNGILSVTSVTTLAAGAGNNITLNNAGNDFSAVGITSGNNVTLRDTNALTLGASTVSGNLGITTNGAAVFNGTSTVGGTLDVNTTSNGIINQTAGTVSVIGITTLVAGSSNDITLNNSNNFSSIGITSGNNVSLTNAGALALNASTVSGTLGVTTGGAITQNGILSVTGTTTFAAGSGNNITLGLSNDFSSIGITTGNNVSITDANAIALNASTISGTLGINTSGAITQNGILNVTGATTLAAGSGNNITLGLSNDFNSIGITTGNNVSITDANAIALNASTISGTLGVTTGGAIIQNGILNVTGATTLAAGSGNNITLGLANNFSSIGITTGNNVSITDANAIALNASTISGTFGVNTSGAITQNGILNVTGATTLAAGSGNNITLSNSSNNFSSVGITSGNNVALRDINALTLGASTISGNVGITTNGAAVFNGTSTIGGTLDVNTTSNGIINQTAGTVSVTGITTLVAGSSNDITLNNSNNFSSIGITSGNNVSVKNAGALALNASTVSGTFDVMAGGSITQNGALNVTGATTLTASGPTSDITLNTGTNDFSSIGIAAGRNVSITDANAIALNASTISGTLGINTSGAITQNGILNVTGATTLAAGSGNNITLGLSNNLNSIGITNGNNVSITNAGSIVLNTSTVSGTYTINAGNSITQNGVLTITGTPTFTGTSANTDILLADAANNFSVTPVITNNGNVRDFALRNVASSAVTPILPSGLRNLTLAFDNANMALPGMTLTGNLSATATGTLTTNGVINTNGGNVNLVTLSPDSAARVLTIGAGINTSGGSISANAANPDDIAAALVVNGVLNTTGGSGPLGSLTLGGGVAFNVTHVQGPGDIILQGNGMDLTLGNLTFTQAINFAVNRNIYITGALQTTGVGSDLGLLSDSLNNNAGGVLIASTGSVNSSGNLTIKGEKLLGTNQNTGIQLQTGRSLTAVGDILLQNTLGNNGGISLGGSVTSTNGNITLASATAPIEETIGGLISSGLLTTSSAGGTILNGANTVTGFNAINTTGDIQLTNTASTLNITGISETGGNIIINNTGALALTGAVNAGSGNTTLNATDAITASAPITTNLLTVKTQNNAGAAITLNNASNNVVTLNLLARNAVDSANAAGNISYQGEGVDIAGIGTTGALNLATTGAITQSGALTIDGITTLASGAANNITLTNAGNSFSTVGVTSANNVTITDANNFDFGASTIAGAFAINTTGTISQSGNVSAQSLATISTGGTLLNKSNTIGVFNATNNGGGNIALTNTGPLIVTGLNQNGSGGYAGITNNGSVTMNTGINNNNIQLSLNAGSANDIIFNNNLTVGGLNISNTRNVTNNALLQVNSYMQTGGTGTTALGNSGLLSQGVASISTNAVNGTINVASPLTLGVNSANLFGSVGGKTGADVINNIVFLTPPRTNAYFFNGLDLAAPTTIANSTNVPNVPSIIMASAPSSSSDNSSGSGTIGTTIEGVITFGQEPVKITTHQGPDGKPISCVNVGAGISVCSGG